MRMEKMFVEIDTIHNKIGKLIEKASNPDLVFLSEMALYWYAAANSKLDKLTSEQRCKAEYNIRVKLRKFLENLGEI